MTAKRTKVRSDTQRSLALRAKFMKALRAGQISSWQEAAALLDVSHTSVFNMLRDARRDGHRIATRTGGAWLIVGRGAK